MNLSRITLTSFVVSLVVWIWFTWPLPAHLSDGVPMSHAGGHEAPLRFMEPGDHLQLMYYFWLFSDMVSGQTPWMYNPYEFHTGEESARYAPDAYYAPFSWFFTAFQLMGNRALAYNLTGFLSIWLTYLFTWLWIRRYLPIIWIAASASLLAILFPYRWFSLLGGSPTGLSMLWIPVMLLGLDLAVREERKTGGWMAGMAILFAYTSDLHAFFFAALITPVWCLFALLLRRNFVWRNWGAYRGIALALLPAAALGLLAATHSLTAVGLSTELGPQGHADVHGHSPGWRGFFWWPEIGRHSQIYMGYALMSVVLAGFAIALRRRSADLLPMVVLALLTAGIALLAIGPHGPFEGFFFRAARKLISPYNTIRQSGKIFILMPSILSLLMALSLKQIVSLFPSRWTPAVAILPVLLMAAEYGRRSDPPICLLVGHQPAYAAVAADAEQAGDRAHALIIPLWPGDSHYASAYQYYCSLYRIRMMNGYSPISNPIYYDEIFLRFQSINQGWLTDDQADELLERGVHHLILHADLFPEKVSPFPVAYTLLHLLEHPRLHMLQQDGPIWAFRILSDPQDTPPLHTYHPHVLLPARHWLFARQPNEGGEVRQEKSASRGQYLHLPGPQTSALAASTEAPPAPDLKWLVRARGDARLEATVFAADQIISETALSVASPAWEWLDIPFQPNGYVEYSLSLTLLDGSADLCSSLLTSGQESLSLENLPAAWFFHAGFLNPESGHVHLRRGVDRQGAVFYGPKLPVGAGSFAASMQHTSAAPRGTLLGHLEIEQLFHPFERVRVPVLANQTPLLPFELEHNLPINVIFYYSGEADMEITSISIKKLNP